MFRNKRKTYSRKNFFESKKAAQIGLPSSLSPLIYLINASGAYLQ